MKKVVLLSLLVLLSLTGCVSTGLISLEEEGLITKQPIRITDSSNVGNFVFRGQISKSDRKAASFSDEIPSDDSTSFSHFTYNIPQFQFNGEAEFVITDHIAFLGGISYGKVDGREYLGTHIGAALFNISKENTFRFDIGAKYQQLRYNLVYSASSNEIFEHSKFLGIYNVKSSERYTNLYVGFTLNTHKKDAFVNIFISYLLSYQTFFDHNTTNDKPAIDLMESVHSISFGGYKNINNFGRILLGARLTNLNFEFGSTNPFDLFLQLDFGI